MSPAKALAAAGRFVDELRQQDAQSDARACPKKGTEPKDNPHKEGASPSAHCGSHRPHCPPHGGCGRQCGPWGVVHPYVTAAIARYVEDSSGDIEVDLDAVVSEAEGGAFVQMWGWVDAEETVHG